MTEPAAPVFGLWERLSHTPAEVALPSLLACLAYVGVLAWNRPPNALLRGCLSVAWVAHAMAILADVLAWGAGPAQASAMAGARFGFAPALSATMWMLLGVYILEQRLLPVLSLRRTLAAFAMLMVGLACVFPGEFRPSLGSPWAPLHWVLGIASYGLFAAAVLHAVMLNRAETRLRSHHMSSEAPGLPLLELEALTFRFVAAGFMTLTLALALGLGLGLAAMPTWRWDHKVVFSLVAWGVFAGLLCGRWRLGWRGRQATRWIYAGAGLLLLSYAGTRFVIEILLRRQA